METDVQKSNVVMTADIVPFFAEVTTTEKESVAEQLAKMEAEAIVLAADLNIIEVKDQESYDAGAEKVKEAKKFVKDRTEWFEPIRLLTYGLYQKVLDRRGLIVKAVDSLATIKDASLKTFEREQEQKRIKLQREAEERQRREEEERRLEAATAAEAVGLSEAAIQTILTAPVTTPAPIAAPTFTRAKGLGHRENWCAEEDPATGGFWALVKAAAKNKALLPLLEVNIPALNAQARSLKTAMQIPGFKAVNKGS